MNLTTASTEHSYYTINKCTHTDGGVYQYYALSPTGTGSGTGSGTGTGLGAVSRMEGSGFKETILSETVIGVSSKLLSLFFYP